MSYSIEATERQAGGPQREREPVLHFLWGHPLAGLSSSRVCKLVAGLVTYTPSPASLLTKPDSNIPGKGSDQLHLVKAAAGSQRPGRCRSGALIDQA